MNHARAVTALDIGTRTVRVLFADLSSEGIAVRAWGSTRMQGMRKGAVISVDEAAASVRSVMETACAGANLPTRSVRLAVAGRDVRAIRSSGLVVLRSGKVSESDVLTAIERAREIFVPMDEEALHILPVSYAVDGARVLAEPVGMKGSQLEAEVNIITIRSSHRESLLRACRTAGADVGEMVFGPLATAAAVLTEKELHEGVILADIGGGTSEFSWFRHGALVRTASYAVGGDHVTNDLSLGLGVSAHEAEDLKCACGAVSAASGQTHGKIRTGSAASAVGSIADIVRIVRPRAEEMLDRFQHDFVKNIHRTEVPFGVVFCGGGALLRGFADLAETVFGLPVRSGVAGAKHRCLSHEVCRQEYVTAFGIIARAQESFIGELTRKPASAPAASAFTIGKRFSGYMSGLNILKKREGGQYV